MKGRIIHVGKTFFIVISLIGLFLLIITIGSIIHEIVINIRHKGLIELSDGTCNLIRWALVISLIMLTVGLVGLTKCDEEIEKRVKILRRILELK